jgi:hypothetical protein
MDKTPVDNTAINNAIINEAVLRSARTAAAAPPELDFITPDRARHAREERERPIVFDLPKTGGKALVRRVTLSDVASIARLPESLQRRVLAMVDELQRIGEPTALKVDGTIDYDKALKLLKGDADGVDAVCVMGFLRPPLIFDERERTSPDQVPVGDLDPVDRRAFYDFCTGKQEAEAARLEPFPAGPVAALAPGGPGGVDPQPPVDPAGSAGGGL